MATKNPFDLLDDDTEDPSLLIAAIEKQKLEKPKKSPSSAPAQPGKAAKLPTKPLPPAQAVREAKNEPGRGGRGIGRGRGRGGSGFNRDSNFSDNSNGFSGLHRPSEEGGGKQAERRGYGGPRGSFRGGRGGDFNSGESGDGERPRRMYDRRSGTGRGNEFKRDGAGRGNWGSPTDEVAPETEENIPVDEKNVSSEKQSGEEDGADASKEKAANEAEEPETKEMTLEEYEKILEEKRKALLALKTEGRKVDVKEFESMQQLSNKKTNDDIFIKLSVSINEFLKPAEGERYYGPGRGRGRGRGPRGGYGVNTASNVATPSIEDPGHFPSLGGK